MKENTATSAAGETLAKKDFAEYGKGNVIFLDGSADGMERTMKQIQALMVKHAGTDFNDATDRNKKGGTIISQ